MAFLLMSSFTLLSDRQQIFILVGLVAVVGVPHGALDPLVAYAAGIARSRSQMLRFLGLYLLQAAAMLLMWYVLPVAALALFLLMSILHFSGDWKNERPRWQRLAAAATIIGAPPLFYPQETARIFAVLVPETAVPTLMIVLQFLAVLAIGTLMMGILHSVRRSWLSAAELASLPLLAWALPPIPFFVVYFCGLHSPKHFLEIVRQLQIPPTVILAVAVGTTLATLSFGTAAFMLLPTVSVNERLVQIIFIGLAVLTVPHMYLLQKVEWLEAQRG
jgi:Brp/Blh family beta-carotene 15,15'-monooxygenase